MIQLINKQVTYLKEADIKKAWRYQDVYLENNPIYDPRDRVPTVRPSLQFEEAREKEPTSFIVKTVESVDSQLYYNDETEEDVTEDEER